MPKLTKTLVETTVPGLKAGYLWDDQLAGFGVKVLPSGRKQYLVKYRVGGGRRAQQRWLQLGAHGAVTVDEARKRARQTLAAAARGEDPQRDKQESRTAPTLAEAWTRFAMEHLPRRKAATQQLYEQAWRLYLEPALGARRVKEITRSDIAELHAGLSDRPYMANRMLAVASKLFSMAELWQWRLDGSNPCRRIEKYSETARERYLSADEIEQLGTAIRDLEDGGKISVAAAAAVRLLLFTGARVSEILSSRWAWINWDRRVLSLPDAKTGSRDLYLSLAAIDLLEDLRRHQGADTVFIIPGRVVGAPMTTLKKPWSLICKEAGIDGLRLHDLRHSAASIAVGQGVGLPIIGRLLGHRSPVMTQRYAHVADDPALAAADLISDQVSGALRRSAE
jgi:integrase